MKRDKNVYKYSEGMYINNLVAIHLLYLKVCVAWFFVTDLMQSSH